jgi:hypothetical protein
VKPRNDITLYQQPKSLITVEMNANKKPLSLTFVEYVSGLCFPWVFGGLKIKTSAYRKSRFNLVNGTQKPLKTQGLKTRALHLNTKLAYLRGFFWFCNGLVHVAAGHLHFAVAHDYRIQKRHDKCT